MQIILRRSVEQFNSCTGPYVTEGEPLLFCIHQTPVMPGLAIYRNCEKSVWGRWPYKLINGQWLFKTRWEPSTIPKGWLLIVDDALYCACWSACVNTNRAVSTLVSCDGLRWIWNHDRLRYILMISLSRIHWMSSKNKSKKMQSTERMNQRLSDHREMRWWIKADVRSMDWLWCWVGDITVVVTWYEIPVAEFLGGLFTNSTDLYCWPVCQLMIY